MAQLCTVNARPVILHADADLPRIVFHLVERRGDMDAAISPTVFNCVRNQIPQALSKDGQITRDVRQPRRYCVLNTGPTLFNQHSNAIANIVEYF